MRTTGVASRKPQVRASLITIVMVVLALLACVWSPVRALAAESSLDLQLARGIETVNEPFALENMLPGDAASIETRVEVSHREPLTVWFAGELTQDTSALAQAINLDIVDGDTGKRVWSGSLATLDAGDPVAVPLDAPEGGLSVIDWTVIASVPFEVGNEYQAQRCTVDLHWWVDAEDAGSLAPLPKTGDDMRAVALLAIVALAAVLAVVLVRRRAAAAEGATAEGSLAAGLPAQGAPSPTNYRVRAAVIAGVITACVALAGAAWALLHAEDAVPGNLFATGTVDVELSVAGGSAHESAYVEPGFRLVRELTVTNAGTADFYYQIGFTRFEGELESTLTATLRDAEGAVLYAGPASGLKTEPVTVAEPLVPSVSRDFVLEIAMREGAGNEHQGAEVTYELSARATQAKNNEERAF